MKITEHDALTNITIDRDMTANELKQFNADKAIYETRKTEAEAKKAQRQAILNRLGLTEEEARILLGGN